MILYGQGSYMANNTILAALLFIGLLASMFTLRLSNMRLNGDQIKKVFNAFYLFLPGKLVNVVVAYLLTPD